VWQIRASQVKEIRHLECFATQSHLSSALLATLSAKQPSNRNRPLRVNQERGSRFYEDFFGSNQGPKWLLHPQPEQNAGGPNTGLPFVPAKQAETRFSCPQQSLTRHQWKTQRTFSAFDGPPVDNHYRRTVFLPPPPPPRSTTLDTRVRACEACKRGQGWGCSAAAEHGFEKDVR
jgi:hypothetical protein